ncbi:MAG: exodeoxyribonuclease VII large subunit [Spirochaetaceae bacterium]|nr:MAG: exodeoxyribonuclease VII large subunit [Spirochaetaceae bacterium]
MSERHAVTLTVAELTQRIKNELEERFPFVAVEGELSNVRPSSTGHLYFTLKDDDSAISAVIFRGRASALTFDPADGQSVIAYGSIGVYAKRGTYQIIVERMELAGIGRILAMLEERKQRLAAEGLFDADRKRPLPLVPERVAIVTSPTGAALRDILQVLARRNAGLHATVCPTPVQGDDAAATIARMIAIASTHRLGDVVIVARGGGSIEDLLPFSDEAVVRAIAACDVPVISAVGHEIDWTLSDFAADLRAPTPSAAAELVSASRIELTTRVLQLGSAIAGSFVERFRRARLLLRQFSPEELHRSYWMIAQPVVQEFDRLRDDLSDAMTERITDVRHRLAVATERLVSLSPYSVLARGYSITRDATGAVVTDASAVSVGETVSVELRSGKIVADIKECSREEL